MSTDQTPPAAPPAATVPETPPTEAEILEGMKMFLIAYRLPAAILLYPLPNGQVAAVRLNTPYKAAVGALKHLVRNMEAALAQEEAKKGPKIIQLN